MRSLPCQSNIVSIIIMLFHSEKVILESWTFVCELLRAKNMEMDRSPVPDQRKERTARHCLGTRVLKVQNIPVGGLVRFQKYFNL